MISKHLLAACCATALVTMTFGTAAMDDAEGPETPRAGWDFKFKDFVIAAWCPPALSDVEFQFYKDAGFNLVMSSRYQSPEIALDLAKKHGLMVMIDTYTKHDNPWGGTAGPHVPHPLHHPATLPELKWLHEQYGNHPALAGYLLGDDYGALPPELVETTIWMQANTPRLFPWICQNVFNPASLAEHGNPFANPQIYPTLYQRDLPAYEQAERYCKTLNHLRLSCLKYDLVSWPMFNVSAIDTNDTMDSDSLTRFQVYAALAYGAQGIWYFTYRGYGSLAAGDEGAEPFQTVEEMEASLDPKWHVAKGANHRVAAWGPHLLGREADKVFHTGSWPRPSAAIQQPGPDGLVLEMDGDLLVGILREEGQPPLAMVVDKRVDKTRHALTPREVRVRFADTVETISVLEQNDERLIDGASISLSLPAGGGQLVRLNVRD